MVGMNSSDGKDVTFILDGDGKVYGIHYDHYSASGLRSETYYFAFNAQGDVIGIYDFGGRLMATYDYDEWGNCTVNVLAADSNGHAIDSPDHVAYVNPCQDRGRFCVLRKISKRHNSGPCPIFNESGYVKITPYGEEIQPYASAASKVSKVTAVITVVSLSLDIANTWTANNGNTNGKRVIKTAIQISGVAVCAGGGMVREAAATYALANCWNPSGWMKTGDGSVS